MNVEIKKEDKNVMELLIEDLTLASMLTKYLNLDERVEYAAFRQEHPQSEEIYVIFKTKDGYEPRPVLKDVISRMKSDVSMLREQMLNAL